MTHKDKIVYDGFHKIERIQATIKGRSVTRERLILPSAVAGFVIDTRNRMALVTQYRPTVRQMTKEIPAGMLDKGGLSPLETLIEELAEECEMNQSDILEIHTEPIRQYYMVTGSSDAQICIYFVKVKEQDYLTKDVSDDHDVEQVEWVTLEQAQYYQEQGWIVDAKTLFALDYFRQYLAEEGE